MMKFLEEARAYQDSMIQDLRELVKIESVRDDAHATKEAPFGPNIAKCLDKALEIGKRDGFKVENVDGHAGVIQYGDLGFSDTWMSFPLETVGTLILWGEK